MKVDCLLSLTITNGDGARVSIVTDTFGAFAGVQDPNDKNRWGIRILSADGAGTGASIVIYKSGYKDINHRLEFAAGTVPPPGIPWPSIPPNGAWELVSEILVPIFPPVPSREEVLGVNTSFMGGIIIESQQYARMPWWDAALSWMQIPSDRQLVYQAKKDNQAQLASGPETHCILEVPSGAPLYNEGGQFYSPDKFGPLDWTNGLTSLNQQFDNLLMEIIENGFKVQIFMQEDYETSIQVIPLVAQRIKDLELTKYCVVMPGYDGVFYGWTPQQIMNWGAIARNINPDILLGLEFQPGEIPLGLGPADYAPGGQMENFDSILAETRWPPDPTIWAIFSRCLLDYVVQPDQTSDFPPVPFYLLNSDRGPRVFVGWETYEPYEWVRVDPYNDAQVAVVRESLKTIRTYYRACGSQYNG